MVSPALFVLMQALLAATADDYQEDDEIGLNKCCDAFEMLSADGKSCVEAPWPRNASLEIDADGVSAPDGEWLSRWLPPGLPLQNINYVFSKYFIPPGVVYSVNASSLWNSSLLQNEDQWKNTVATLEGGLYIARPRPGGGLRTAIYCLDAAPPPLGPFAMWVRTECTQEECAYKCCRKEELMKNKDGRWKCGKDAEGHWTPNNSSLALDPEFPTYYFRWDSPDGFRLSSWNAYNARNSLRDEGTVHFQFSYWKSCFDYYRDSDGNLHEGLFYVQHSRVTRGVYWLLRPLCVLSTLLLLMSLVSIACDKSMRRKNHGRCLASYSACLLAFNIGQMVYYVAISDLVYEGKKQLMPKHLEKVCKYFALWMYFVLTAAWCWLTALCVNMAKGFSLQVTRRKKESWKRFLALSAFAWGLPVLLTITCAFIFAHEIAYDGVAHWYNPSVAESRVCYNEYVVYDKGNDTDTTDSKLYLLKSGTALFYFGPVACLVICNIICLALTLKKVQFLKRGNSVLRREEDQIPLGQRHPEGNNPPSTQTARGHGNRNSVDAKTIKLYIKMILMSGGIELLTEVIMWSTTIYNGIPSMLSYLDLGLAYRAAGYVTDCFRAAVVTWLAAPEGGYLGLVKRLRPGKGDKKSARAGHAGRRKQNEA